MTASEELTPSPAGPSERVECHIQITANARPAVEWLSESSGLAKTRIKHAMTSGAVWLTRGRKTHRVRRATRPLNRGDELHLYYDARILALAPTPPELIADEGAYSVWNKPYGMLSQGSRWGDHCTITRWAERHLPPARSAFIVHRIDRAASGLILVAHEKRSAAALSALFKQRRIEKRYRAIVHGKVNDSEQPTLLDAPLDDRDARTRFSVLEYDSVADRTLLDVTIETGRKHQIRRHLADIGATVVGDRLYGSSDTSVDLQLAAYLLAFRFENVDRRYQLTELLSLPSTSNQP